MAWIGIGYRQPLAAWIARRPREVECLEITAEHFFDGGHDLLRQLAKDYPLFVHGLGLSLGTPGPLDAKTLEQFAEVVAAAQPEWISEHVAFTRSAEVDLGHLNPLQPSRDTLRVLVEHARRLSERCRRPLILENITSYLRIEGEMSEPEFLNRLCEEAGCGLLLDVTNLFINSRNHRFDPVAWLHQLEPQRIVQLHVVGYSQRGGRWHDYHAEPIQNDLRELLEEVLAYAPVRAVVVERDGNFPSSETLAQELRWLRNILDIHRPDHGAGAPA